MKDNILIVGAGPTGLTAGLVLAQRGLRPRIIDKRSDPISTSNALAIQPRTLELWESLGLIDDALSEGHPIHGITITNKQKILGKISTDNLPTKYPFVLALPQAKTEKLLAKHLLHYDIAVERGVTLENLKDKGNCVEVICNGKSKEYDWVLGCDGAKSVVRESAGIPFRGSDLPQHFIMADLPIEWDRSTDQAHVFYSRQGPIVFFPLDDKGFGRLIIDVSADKRLKSETHPKIEDFRQLMQQRCHVPVSLHEPSWISSFWVHSRIADTYTKGRLFLAGDAAHLHSPIGGQGLNTGFRDAYFLGNLLADVIQGKKSEEDLQEYEKTRRAIGKNIVQKTEFMTRVATTQSPFLQTLRNAIMKLFLSIPFLRRKVMMTISQLY